MVKISDSRKNYLKFISSYILNFGTATVSFKIGMISKHVEMDPILVIKISMIFCLSPIFFCHILRKACCNLPVVRVMAIPKRRTVVLKVILHPIAEKSIEDFPQTKF